MHVDVPPYKICRKAKYRIPSKVHKVKQYIKGGRAMRKDKQKPMLKLMYQRKKAGLTQEALADKVGLKKMTIHYYEKGSRVPNALILAKLAKALGCKIDDIV